MPVFVVFEFIPQNSWIMDFLVRPAGRWHAIFPDVPKGLFEQIRMIKNTFLRLTRCVCSWWKWKSTDNTQSTLSSRNRYKSTRQIRYRILSLIGSKNKEKLDTIWSNHIVSWQPLSRLRKWCCIWRGHFLQNLSINSSLIDQILCVFRLCILLMTTVTRFSVLDQW